MPNLYTPVASNPQQLSLQQRRAMLLNGHRPVPVKTGTKRPAMTNWPDLAAAATAESVATWPADHGSTGILCGAVRGVDIDVLDADTAAKVELLAYDTLGMSPLRRVGQAPKVLLLYRAADPAAGKVTSAAFTWPGVFSPGTTKLVNQKIEVLGAGQQAVCFGMHPDTGRPYSWHGVTPEDVPLADLPLVTEAEVAAFLVAAERILEAGGGRRVGAGTSARTGERQSPRHAPPSIQAVVDLFDAMPNPEHTTRDHWMKLGHAAVGCIHDTDGDMHGPIAEAFIGWAERGDDSKEPTRHKWETDFARQVVGSVHGGYATALRVARELDPGFREPAAGVEFDPLPETEPTPGAWKSMLQLTDKQTPKGNLLNACTAFQRAPEWRGVVRHDDFANRTAFASAPPWHTGPFAPHELRDVDITRAATWLQDVGIQVPPGTAGEALADVAERNRFHPVRDYLDGLVWDGAPRLDTWLSDHMGAEDTPLHRAFASKFMLSMVARVRRPGCKVDTVLILEGRQGLRKSSALAALANGWFTDHVPDLTSKDAALQLHGVWLVEFAELDKLHRAEAARAKAFISTGTDRLRKPFGRVAEDFPRQCVFAGTVNPGATGYLQDETGNRRFWPVACGLGWPADRTVDLAAITAARGQLWAEAQHRYAAGEAWWLDGDLLDQAQARAAAERLTVDVWQDRISSFVCDKTDVSVGDILSVPLAKPAASWTTADQMRVGRVLTVLGWDRRRVRLQGGQREWRYFPGPVVPPLRLVPTTLAEVGTAIC